MTYCLLAPSMENIMTIVQLLPMIVLVLGAIIGFATGLRKMPRAGIAWMVAAGLYSVLLEVLQGVLGEIQPVFPVIIATISCAIVAVAFFVGTKVLLYPHDKDMMRSDIQKILEKEDKFRQIEREELEELKKDSDVDEKDFERLERRQRKRRKRYFNKMEGKPSFLSRVIAAAVVGIDMMFVTIVLIDICALVITSTPLAGILSSLCELESFQAVVATAQKTTIDYLVIGAFMFAVVKGYEKGALNAVYTFFSSIASIAAFAVGFYIPFSPIGAEGGALAFTAGFVDTVFGMLQPLLSAQVPIAIPDDVYQILAKVAVGLVYTVVLLIVMWIIKRMLRKASYASYDNAPFHVFDGFLGVVLGVLTCIIVLAVIFFALLIVQKIGWYSVSENLFSGTQIFDLLYAEFSNFAGGWADKVVALLPLGK